MVKAVLQRYSDNVARKATVTVTTGSVAPGYLLSWLIDDDPARPCKFNETSVTLLFDWETPQRQDTVALIHANLATGLSVQYQCNATNSWGSPTVSASLVIPGYRENKYPINAYLDLTMVAGYSSGGFRYGRLVVSGTNPVAIALGEFLIIAPKRQVEWLDNRQKFNDERKIVSHETDAGVQTTFDLGVHIRRFEGSLTNRNNQRQELDGHWADACGQSYPFLFIPNSLNGEPWLVRWQDPMKEDNFTSVGVSTLSCKFIEVGRGLYPTPSAV